MTMGYQAPNILPSGISFSQLQSDGASGHLEALITANKTATANPTAAATISVTGGGQSIVNPTVQATASATGGGQTVAVPTTQATVSVGAATTGSLPAGTYYVGYTFVTPSGETTMGAGSPAASVSAQFTQTSGKTPTVTLPNLAAGATSMNLYLSNTNGSNTALVLYATGITQATGATYVLNSALWNGQAFANGTAPPVSNTTTGNMTAAATGNYFGYTWVHPHGETTLGSSVSTVTAIAAGNVPQVTIPSLPAGATSANIYMSNTNGTNTALKLIATGVTTTTVNLNTSTWNGVTFANGTAPPASNTTVGELAPGVYLLNFTETDGQGETIVSTESAPFTVTSQSNPSNQATGSGSGSGGSLPAGTYLAAYTYYDANGNETTAGTTESAGITISATNTLTITYNDTLPGWAVGRNLYLTAAGGASGTETLYATAQTGSTTACNSATFAGTKGLPTANTTSVDYPRVTFPALQTNNVSRNVYLTAPGGATGTEVLYAEGVRTLTYDLAIAAPGGNFAIAPPATNTTGYLLNDFQMIRKAKSGNLQDVYKRYRDILYEFNRGTPIAPGKATAHFRRIHNVFAIFSQMLLEAATLVDANPGHISNVTTGIGNQSPKRTWP